MGLKRLSVFSIRSFIGPFIVTFLISMFILVMQFFWKYIDDLMGKGLPFTVILELLFYVSASLIPLALPLAILLSSIMTLGNLAENNELTALKSSGLSLYRILRPLIFAVCIIAISTFYFANYVIPVANLKWRSLIYDIQNTKIAALLTPGAYTQELDGYAIKVEKLEGDTFTNILIHDHTSNNQLKTVRAKSGKLYKSNNGKYIYFELIDGSVIEELETQAPIFDGNQRLIPGASSTRPSRRSEFKNSIYKIDVSGFNLQRSNENLFENEYEMLNVFQIQTAKDSIQIRCNEVMNNFADGHINEDLLYQSLKMDTSAMAKLEGFQSQALPERSLAWGDFNEGEQKGAIISVQAKLRRKIESINSQFDFFQVLNKNLREFDIEMHRKFALTYAIIILFFVGAPLGAIVRKGGFGAPVVIAALLFMVYFVLISTGESLSRSGVLSPWLGMWFASILLTPFAIWLMRSAANDSPLFVMDNWTKGFEKFKKKNKNEGITSK
ncbi:MAG: LptF/LptG family permease [Bacteroidetes bacterium]|nr:LptF/LptG family permease [Bacteroidota bacterium]